MQVVPEEGWAVECGGWGRGVDWGGGRVRKVRGKGEGSGMGSDGGKVRGPSARREGREVLVSLLSQPCYASEQRPIPYLAPAFR